MNSSIPFVFGFDPNLCPCKECKTRKVGCHGTCEGYKDWRSWKDRRDSDMRKAKQMQNIGHNR